MLRILTILSCLITFFISSRLLSAPDSILNGLGLFSILLSVYLVYVSFKGKF